MATFPAKGIKDIHGVFGTSVQILTHFSVDQGGVLLRKENRRIDGTGFVVKTRRFVGRKISSQMWVVMAFEICLRLTDLDLIL